MKESLNKAPLWIIAAAAALLLMLTLSHSESGAATQQEQRIAEVLSSIAGAGKVDIVLYYAPQTNPAFGTGEDACPTGALIVAEGAEDMAVRLNLIRAVRTLLNLPENAVDVFAMEEKGR